MPSKYAERLTALKVRRGDIIGGSFKRPGRPARPMTFEVSAALVSNDRPYLFGTVMNGDTAGLTTAIRADGFDFRYVQVTPAPEGTELIDPAPYYISGRDNPHFQYIEAVDPELVELAIENGSVPITNVVVDHVLVRALQPEEPAAP